MNLPGWRRFNGNVLTNAGRIDLVAVKADPEVHRCGEFDFIISEFNMKPRISELASIQYNTIKYNTIQNVFI